MTKDQLAAVLNGVASLAHALDAADIQSFEDATNSLIAELTPVLPAKEDGTAYTDAELAAAATAARAPFLEVLQRDAPPA